MFIGHFAPALAASAASPDAPRLGRLFAAAQLVDLAFFTLLMFGIEDMRVVPGITAMNPMDLTRMPYTHSLLATALWSAGFGLIVWRLARSSAAGVWAALAVGSHWFLDLLVHRPDLTLVGSSPKFGLGLWNHPLVEMPLELGLIGGAFWFYVSRTRGPVGPPLILLGTMLLFQAINWFGPQPTEYNPSIPLLALFSYAVLIALARWVGQSRHHRHAAGLAMPSRPR